MKKMWLGVQTAIATLFVASTAMAQEVAASNAQDVGMAAALDGIARNPNASDKLFTPMILVLALIESLAIYALVIAIMLLGKIPSAAG